MSKLLCKIGIHRPLRNHVFSFTDRVSTRSVYNAICPCGNKWMVDSLFSFGGFKVKRLMAEQRWP